MNGTMRTAFAAAGIVAAAIAWAVPAQAFSDQDRDWCNGTDANQAISGCTALIQSGQLSTGNLAVAFDNRGVVYEGLGQYARAMQDFDEAIRLNPNDVKAYYERSLAKRGAGDAAGAMADLVKARAINSKVVASGNSPSPPSDRSSTVPVPNPGHATPGSDAIEIAYWQSIRNSRKPEDFESYLKTYPDGHFADLAHDRLAALHAPADVCQSVTGTWSWFVNGDVTFAAGGTAKQSRTGFTGTWTCHEGLVKISWPFAMVDTLTLSSDGKHLRGHGGLFGLDTVWGDRKDDSTKPP